MFPFKAWSKSERMAGSVTARNFFLELVKQASEQVPRRVTMLLGIHR